MASILLVGLLSTALWFAHDNYKQNLELIERKVRIINALDEYDQGNELDRRYLSELLHDLEYLPTGDLVFTLLENNKVSDAVSSLKASLENITTGDPAYVRTLHYIGALSYQTDPAESESAYKLVLNIDPNDIDAMIRLGRVYDVLGHSDLSTELYRSAYDNTIETEELYWIEIDIAFNQLIMSNYELGINMFETLFNRIGAEIPKNSRLASRIYTDLGVAQYLIGNPQEAESIALTAIKKQKKDGHYYDLSRSHSLMGFLLMQKNSADTNTDSENLSAALFHYQKQFEYAQLLNSPRKIDEANIGLGQVYFRAGELDNARRHLNLGSLSKNQLHKFEALLTLSELEWSLNNKIKACDYLVRVNRLKKNLRTNFSPETKSRVLSIKCELDFNWTVD